MDALILIITAALSFAAGIGAYITFINSEKLDFDESPDMESKLEKKNTELKQYQQEVSEHFFCLLYTSPSPRDKTVSRMPSSA